MDRHGNVRLYVRIKGRPKVRLLQQPGTEAFMVEYRQALAGVATGPAKRPRAVTAQPGSLRWLCAQYFESPGFRKTLGQSTREARRGILETICQGKRGEKPFALMEPRHVAKIRDEKADLPAAANARVKALRQVFKWAMSPEYALATDNPAAKVSYLSGNPDGFHAWTVEEVAQYEACHPVGTKARLALALLLYTGVRRSDVIRLGPQMERDGWLKFTEAKNAAHAPKEREIPILPEMRAVLDATPSGHLAYLVSEWGRPYTHGSFGNKMRDWCNAAGLPHCAAHGLRKAGATIAADNGATEHQLMSIFGWDSPKQAALYTRKANRKKMAGDAMHFLVPDQKSNVSVPLLAGVQKGGTK